MCYGGNGDPADCAPNQFQGGTVESNKDTKPPLYMNAGLQVRGGGIYPRQRRSVRLFMSVHSVFALFVRQLYLRVFADAILSVWKGDPEVTDALSSYVKLVDTYVEAVPLPPKTSTLDGYNGAQQAVIAVLPKVIGWDTIPTEYFAMPVDTYIPYWPVPNDPTMGGYIPEVNRDLYEQLTKR